MLLSTQRATVKSNKSSKESVEHRSLQHRKRYKDKHRCVGMHVHKHTSTHTQTPLNKQISLLDPHKATCMYMTLGTDRPGGSELPPPYPKD